MEKRNLLQCSKAAVAAACGAFTAVFGWLGWLVLAWGACMALDWASGSAAAACKGQWSSAAARAGIWHKAGMVEGLGVSAAHAVGNKCLRCWKYDTSVGEDGLCPRCAKVLKL